MLPLAEKMKVIIAIEEVWNKFLLSPLEMARYIDEFKSPWVKSYLDVGNMVLLRLSAGLDSHPRKTRRQAAHQGFPLQEPHG